MPVVVFLAFGGALGWCDSFIGNRNIYQTANKNGCDAFPTNTKMTAYFEKSE